MRRLRSFLPILILVGVGIVAWAMGLFDYLSPTRIASEFTEISERIAANPARAYTIYLVVLTLLFAAGIPGPMIVIITGGLLFGVWIGTVLSLTSMVLGSLLLFFAARRAFRSGQRAAPQLVERIRTGYEENPGSYTAFLRLVPLFPFGGVTVALAWLRSPLGLFALATTLGGFTMVLVESALGAGLAQSLADAEEFSFNILAKPKIWVPLVGLGLLALAPVVVQKMKARKATGGNA